MGSIVGSSVVYYVTLHNSHRCRYFQLKDFLSLKRTYLKVSVLIVKSNFEKSLTILFETIFRGINWKITNFINRGKKIFLRTGSSIKAAIKHCSCTNYPLFSACWMVYKSSNLFSSPKAVKVLRLEYRLVNTFPFPTCHRLIDALLMRTYKDPKENVPPW